MDEKRMEERIGLYETGGESMRDLERTIEALKRCVSPEEFNRAMREICDPAIGSGERSAADLESMAQDLLTKNMPSQSNSITPHCNPKSTVRSLHSKATAHSGISRKIMRATKKASIPMKSKPMWTEAAEPS